MCFFHAFELLTALHKQLVRSGDILSKVFDLDRIELQAMPGKLVPEFGGDHLPQSFDLFGLEVGHLAGANIHNERRSQ